MTSAAVAFIERLDIKSGSRILCVWNRRYGGWGMPGGLVEKNETVTDALARELGEETGLSIKGQPEKIWDGPPLTQQKESGRGSHVYVFRVWPSGEPREMEPGAPVTWLTREEFLKFSPFSEFYRPMFEATKVVVFAPYAGCSLCKAIQIADPSRHFRGCPLRKPLPSDHPESNEQRALVAAELCALRKLVRDISREDLVQQAAAAARWAIVATEPTLTGGGPGVDEELQRRHCVVEPQSGGTPEPSK